MIQLCLLTFSTDFEAFVKGLQKQSPSSEAKKEGASQNSGQDKKDKPDDDGMALD